MRHRLIKLGMYSISQGWDEGKYMPEGPDKRIRQQFDNANQGPRWHPRDNKRIKMSPRRSNYTKFSKEAAYTPPHPPEKLSKHLLDDPVHKWRAESGIELIHKEPTAAEQKRIWDNWHEMDEKLRKKSDEKSQEFFGRDNREQMGHILEAYDEDDYYDGDKLTNIFKNFGLE